MISVLPSTAFLSGASSSSATPLLAPARSLLRGIFSKFSVPVSIKSLDCFTLLTSPVSYPTYHFPESHSRPFRSARFTATRPASSSNFSTHSLTPQKSIIMDSMPSARRLTLSLPSFDALKMSEPETKTQHVEHVNTPAETEHQRHLPRGVSETDIERQNKWFIGSIDCGTASSRFLIFDGDGTPTASHQIEFENIYPESG